MPTIGDALERLDREHPAALEALREASAAVNFAPMGFRDKKLDDLLAFIDRVGNDQAIESFTQTHAAIFAAILQGQEPPEQEDPVASLAERISEVFEQGDVVAQFLEGGGAFNIMRLEKDPPPSYGLIYTDDGKADALRQLGKWAASTSHPKFSWYDAAACAQRVRKETEEAVK